MREWSEETRLIASLHSITRIYLIAPGKSKGISLNARNSYGSPQAIARCSHSRATFPIPSCSGSDGESQCAANQSTGGSLPERLESGSPGDRPSHRLTGNLHRISPGVTPISSTARRLASRASRVNQLSQLRRGNSRHSATPVNCSQPTTRLV